MKKIGLLIIVLFLCFMSISLHGKMEENFQGDVAEEVVVSETMTPSPTVPEPEILLPEERSIPTREEIAEKYGDVEPTEWGEDLEGILSEIPTDEKIIALTFDACGWGQGSGYDEELIEFLIEEKIPATLFISGKWIEDNPQKLEYLAGQENFEIENHGYLHKPLSVSGQEAYGVVGTLSPEEVYDEIEVNAETIYSVTGRRPLFFRTGTAYYDEVAVEIASDLGQRIAGYTIAADGGATFTESQILSACSNPPNGAILLFHMNHPESETAEGVSALFRVLSEEGYAFVKLEDCDF